jgi:hypothetical protein
MQDQATLAGTRLGKSLDAVAAKERISGGTAGYGVG